MPKPKASKMEQSCYENGSLGAITWAVLDSLSRSGATVEEISVVVDALNTHLPNLEPTDKNAIVMQCQAALNKAAEGTTGKQMPTSG